MSNARSEIRRSFSLAVGLLSLVAAGLAFRLPQLDKRPMHCDEGNQAVRAGVLLETGQYRYDPREHHGPSLYWLTVPSLRLRGASSIAQSSEIDYRIVPVLFGVALIALLALLADGLGRPATLLAGLLAAISPAMVFYSRYYIQETLLAFFTLGAIGCAWRYLQSRSLAWAAAAGLCFGLMHATKETWVLAATAMVAGVLLALAWTRWREEGKAPVPSCPTGPESALHKRGLSPFLSCVVAGLAAVFAAGLLYSGLGSDWRAPIDSLLAYRNYFQRGSQGGEGGMHTHPWYYYLELLVAFRPARGFFWTEGLIVGLAMIGAVAALVGRGLSDSQRALGRFLAFYTLVLTGLYSAIPYKTPWCLLSFLEGMILLAGLGAWTVLRLAPGRTGKVLAALLLSAGFVHLGRESYALNFRFAADTRNPYVYAHTSPDLLNLADRLERIAQVAPQGHKMTIHVVTPENYWPLPWYLRKFDRQRIGYWQDPAAWSRQAPSLPVPDVIVFTPDVQELVNARLRTAYNKQMLYGLRPGVLLSVYLREELWEAITEARMTIPLTHPRDPT